MNYYNVSLHGFLWIFFFFFSKWSLSICFIIFKKKTLWIVTMFPHMFFFKIIFVEFYFNIKLVENSALILPACFVFHFFSFSFAFFLQKLSSSFFFSFFCVFFFKIVFIDFFFFKNTVDCYSVYPTWFFFIFLLFFFQNCLCWFFFILSWLRI
jgi:hypothetical protein